jgi:glycine/serine hydroxymethyltransferase
MREAEMGEIAALMALVLRKTGDEHIAGDVKHQVNDLCARFTPYPDLFEQ